MINEDPGLTINVHAVIECFGAEIINAGIYINNKILANNL